MAIITYDNVDGTTRPRWWEQTPFRNWGRGLHVRHRVESFDWTRLRGYQGLMFPAGGFVALYLVKVIQCIADTEPVLRVRTGEARTLWKQYPVHSGSYPLAVGDLLDFRTPPPTTPGWTTPPPNDEAGLVFLDVTPEPRRLDLEVFFGTEL